MKFESSPVVVFVAGAALGAMALLSGCTKNSLPDRQPSADELTECVASGEQTYSFDDKSIGQGVNHAIHAIKGSGAGEGAPCWSEAEAAVLAAIGEDGTAIGMKINIPKSFEAINDSDKIDD